MTEKKRRATYQDVLDAPPEIMSTFMDDARVRAEPFDAIELDMSVPWADVVLPEPAR